MGITTTIIRQRDYGLLTPPSSPLTLRGFLDQTSAHDCIMASTPPASPRKAKCPQMPSELGFDARRLLAPVSLSPRKDEVCFRAPSLQLSPPRALPPKHRRCWSETTNTHIKPSPTSAVLSAERRFGFARSASLTISDFTIQEIDQGDDEDGLSTDGTLDGFNDSPGPAQPTNESVPVLLPNTPWPRFDGTEDIPYSTPQVPGVEAPQIVDTPDLSRDLDSDDGSEVNMFCQTPTTPSPPGRADHRLHSVNLTFPANSVIPEPRSGYSDTPTPLTRASPAKGAFPFPLQNCSPGSLSAFRGRSTGSPLRPSQRLLQGSQPPVGRHLSQTPDRFIPVRSHTSSSSDRFRLSSPVGLLTDDERRSRHRRSGPHPFSHRLRAGTGLGEEQRSLQTNHQQSMSRGSSSTIGLRQGRFNSSNRQVSAGAVWGAGGSAAATGITAVPDGRGNVLGSGTNAPIYAALFLSEPEPALEARAHERRLALALDVDQAGRVLGDLRESEAPASPSPTRSGQLNHSSSPRCSSETAWTNNEWTQDEFLRLLDAPALRDDYYCSLLAYSPSAKCLAVGLSNHVYLWSEHRGVGTPDSLNAPYTSHVTSLAFSSVQGGRAILAIGRADGRITLWSPFDEGPRFDSEQPHPVSCVSFRPAVTKRPSLRNPYVTAETEELLVGDEAGHIYVYSIEWPSSNDRDLFAWHGAMTLLARMTAHGQQICGIAWSRDGSLFATGGNDNVCLLFETKAVTFPVPDPGHVLAINASHAKHEFTLNAAIKALAFSPHHPSLLALGGGSNDRHIHFYHAGSAAPLASINCFAQVTSLVWSKTRNEVCATFGFAQPEHPYRIAVFAWPSCQQVVAIPWAEGGRALWSIPYPGGPETGRSRGEGGTWCRRTEQEGCIVVATSESSIKFHEVWSEDRRVKGGLGLLGGSNILESLEGLGQDEEFTIR